MIRNRLWLLPLQFFVGLILVAFASCKPSLPSNIISESKMEDLLYDYHLAQAMANADPGKDGGNAFAYQAAVLKKHGVSQAEFDSSMVYYMRHTELLKGIYENLADRMNQEAVSLGADASDMGRFGNLTSSGDTANVWTLPASLVMTPDKPFNYEGFAWTADTAYHVGDRLMLDFDAQFIYQDGMRDGVVVLAIQFKNDSVASQLLHVQNSQHYSLQVEDRDGLGIKSVKGYFLLGNGSFSMDNGSATTLKLMVIEHIKLIRMHQNLQPANAGGAGQSADSVATVNEDRRMDSARPIPSGPPPSGLPRALPARPLRMEVQK